MTAADLPVGAGRISVVIPARNEAASIAAALDALAAQCDLAGNALPRGCFDVTVFANNCSDDTAGVVRSAAARTPQLRIAVTQAVLPEYAAHIGTARKQAMDAAAARFLRAGRPDGIIASLDGDTLVDRHWIATLAHEIAGRDAVAGQVTLADDDRHRLLAPVRLLYARELTYRRLLAYIEARVDPVPEDPAPRHSSFVGASFAVTVRSYLAAGGLPPLPRLEDFAFAAALRRVDARIRFSTRMRATTSARTAARVRGGFGTFIADLHECARRGTSHAVEHPRRTLEDLTSRAALRRLHRGRPHAGDVARIAAALNLAARHWLPLCDPALPLGTAYERILRRAAAARRPWRPVAVEAAIAALRGAAIEPTAAAEPSESAS